MSAPREPVSCGWLSEPGDEDEPAHAAASDTTWCHWHKGETTTGQLITVIEQASGPGAAVYACAECREWFRLEPA
ncbi:hypothetical protein [Streptomyces sp. TS71-3]|uniref:hypothetical protein n=1 Tax=Streptomyces sp. TS71-3 TaxID=2733862 RepID=UPI001B27DA20|nr:hypothetical protein [Streptomyces sp. TS71-3]GHJ36933.1 hypothetical protein Sm713_25420 [Streptomyces sp. TS71-3]